jgi:hypothetical protein
MAAELAGAEASAPWSSLVSQSVIQSVGGSCLLCVGGMKYVSEVNWCPGWDLNWNRLIKQQLRSVTVHVMLASLSVRFLTIM